MLSPFSSVLTTSYAIVTGFREYPYTPHHHGRLLEIPKGVGSLKPNFLRQSMKLISRGTVVGLGGRGSMKVFWKNMFNLFGCMY